MKKIEELKTNMSYINGKIEALKKSADEKEKRKNPEANRRRLRELRYVLKGRKTGKGDCAKKEQGQTRLK